MEDQKKEYSSIFDAAAQLSKKVAKPEQEKKEGIEPPKQPLLSEEELNARFEQYKKVYEVIADTIDSMLAKKNLSLKKLKEYFQTSSNFNDETWRLIQAQRKQIETQLKELVKTYSKETHPGETSSQEKASKKPEQKPKSMQSRSRWIPMR